MKDEFLNKCYQEEERLYYKLQTARKLINFFSMKGETILIRRSVKEYGLPKKDSTYITEAEGKIHIMSFHAIKNLREYITHWYEEVSVSSFVDQIMPKEKEFSDWADRLEGELMGGDCRRIIEYFKSCLNKL